MVRIYKWINLINGKKYIGQDSTGHRSQDHIRCANSGCTDCGGSSKFHAAIRKYGEENFEEETLEITTLEEADYLEDAYINQEDTLAPSGYNSTLNASPFQLYENRWVCSAEHERILDHIPVVVKEEEREGFQIIKPDSATLHNQRLANVPDWASSNERIRALVNRSFKSRPHAAARMVRIVYLYFRVGQTAESIADVMQMTRKAVQKVLYRANLMATTPAKPKGRPRKGLSIQPTNGSIGEDHKTL